MMGGGKGGDVDMDVDANIDSTNSMEIIGLDDINMKMELVLPDPIRMENDLNSTMEIKPITLNNTSDIGLDMDIKPVTLDFCLKLDFGGPPPMCIRNPYSHHFGITLFGVELLGFNFSGESRTIIDELPKKPQVAWGGERAIRHRSGERDPQVSEAESGLRIRFD
jgi:hypothetical protein